jgi:hypothetical protein
MFKIQMTLFGLILFALMNAHAQAPLPPKEGEPVIVRDISDELLSEPQVEQESRPILYRSADGQSRAPLAPVVQEQGQNNFYLSLQGGALNYPRFANLPTINGAAGLALGAHVWENFSLEAGFLYSFQQQEINQVVQSFREDIDQYMVSGQFKYNWRPKSVSWLSLSPGVVATYNRKVYEAGENSSDAFDAGVSAGADIRLSQNWSIGLEYRFMWNLDYQRERGANNTAVALQQLATGNPSVNLEEAEYQVLLAQLKFGF